ncbi:alpha/beta hydrolase [uncultured Sphingomonas sp.]|uniref:alpha/beta fold hydrolase n=1 Tax=uncultured Sphingomonas sp. TaxID=158754 RepID=UPI003458DFFC
MNADFGIAAARARLSDPTRRTWPLAAFGGERPPVPNWYRAAMAAPVEERRIEVEGADIELLCWGEVGKPGILLVHGSGAHARWWGPVAPMLARDYRVASFSWSGTGGSARRPRYAVAQTAREAWAAMHAGDLFAADTPPVIACHSFGSKAGALLAADHGDRLAGAVFIDALLLADELHPDPGLYRERRYASLSAALGRFRFAPDQDAGHACIADDIARASLREEGGGWTWRFDPDFYARLDFTSGWDEIARASCALAFLRGEDSIVLLDVDVDAQRRQAPHGSIFFDIPDAGHHVMVDQPHALVVALRALIEGWAGQRAVRPEPLHHGKTT